MASLVITVSSSIDNIEKIKYDATLAVENVLDENDIEQDDDTSVDWEVVEL
jgi:hypothetical protein